MMRHGIRDEAVLDELESHLRDHVEAEIAAGVSPAQAFRSGIRRIGSPRRLRCEFDLGEGRPRSWRWLGLAAGLAIALLAGGAVTWNSLRWYRDQPPVYQSKITIEVHVPGAPTPGPKDTNGSRPPWEKTFRPAARALVSSAFGDQVIASLTPAQRQVIHGENFSQPPVAKRQFGWRFWLEHPTDTDLLLSLTITHSSPGVAALIANRYADLACQTFGKATEAYPFTVRLVDRGGISGMPAAQPLPPAALWRAVWPGLATSAAVILAAFGLSRLFRNRPPPPDVRVRVT